MSIATERRQFYDTEICVAARLRGAHVERRYGLAGRPVDDKALFSALRNRIVRQFKATPT
jgi:hypothetical protein